MTTRLAGFLRTTLPLQMDALAGFDSGEYDIVWLPDHMVSFWPDSIWNPEFTDLAVHSPSPHRHLDSLAVAGAAAVMTARVRLGTMVVDTVRRHPAMLAQTALTLDHLSKGRFVLGLGSGEQENIVPYGFDFAKPVSRLEETIRVIRLLWESDGPIDFEGDFYRLDHARLDTEPFNGKFPEIYMAAGGPRALSICGRLADGWIPGAIRTPEDYRDKLSVIRKASYSAGRSHDAVTPYFMATCLIGEDHELEEILTAPLVKAYILQIDAKDLKSVGFDHPMGPDWKGIHDIDPGKLTRDVILDLLKRTTPDMLRAWVPHGPPDKIARHFKGFADAGAQVVKMLDYSGMAGTKFAARSAKLTRESEAELLRLCRGG